MFQMLPLINLVLLVQWRTGAAGPVCLYKVHQTFKPLPLLLPLPLPLLLPLSVPLPLISFCLPTCLCFSLCTCSCPRDDRVDSEYFGLCEVQVFQRRGEQEEEQYGEGRTFLGMPVYSIIYQCVALISTSNIWRHAYDKQTSPCPPWPPEVASCGVPESPVYSRVEVEGGRATYHCVQGFSLRSGDRVRNCSHQGWLGATPSCQGERAFLSIWVKPGRRLRGHKSVFSFFSTSACSPDMIWFILRLQMVSIQPIRQRHKFKTLVKSVALVELG